MSQTRRVAVWLHDRSALSAPGFQKSAVACPASRCSLVVCSARQFSHLFSSGFQGARRTLLRVLPWLTLPSTVLPCLPRCQWISLPSQSSSVWATASLKRTLSNAIASHNPLFSHGMASSRARTLSMGIVFGACSRVAMVGNSGTVPPSSFAQASRNVRKPSLTFFRVFEPSLRSASQACHRLISFRLMRSMRLPRQNCQCPPGCAQRSRSAKAPLADSSPISIRLRCSSMYSLALFSIRSTERN